MESRSQTLHQQRAALGARQGDPENPASGTLHSRRIRLESELAQATSHEENRQASFDHSARRGGGVMTRSPRPTFLIRRDLRLVQQELEAVQAEIDTIDKQLSKNKRKDRG